MASADLVWLSALELASLIRRKVVSPVEVTEAVLARLERLNPGINCFCTVTAEEARDAAVAAEVAVMTGEELGPLHGVPFSVKDVLWTRRVLTTGGSRLFADHVPDEDAVVVERLKGAGGVILGKTTTPEFAHKGVTDSPLFGITRNPWNLALTPGGSSGGAGAAVAAGLGPVRRGHRQRRLHPDPGIVLRDLRAQAVVRAGAAIPGLSRLGDVHAHGPDDAHGARRGPGARRDRRPDDRDRYSIPAESGPSFLESCDAGIAGLSVAWSADLGHGTVDPEVLDLCGQAAERFESLGCHVEVVTPTWDDPAEVFRVLAAAETHAAWGDRLDDGEQHLDRSLVALLRFGRGITIEQYMRASQARHDLWTDVQRFLARFDLLITPTVAVPPFEVGRPGVKEIAGREVGPLDWIPFTYPFNLTGQPAATVPVGFTASGLPVGLQIVGRRHGDRTVLAASAAFEAAAPWADSKPRLD
jgi:aspartyl-tRNA(Asn)/glutamyl-tRNA(Gln) amidotransferase subunit A